MSTLLRKVKSTIAAKTLATPHGQDALSTDCLSGNSASRTRLQKVQSRGDHLVDPYSTNNVVPLHQPGHGHYPHPLTEFRRRVARKASTFSLRSKRWKAELQERGHAHEHAHEAAKEEEKYKEQLLSASQGSSVLSGDQRSDIVFEHTRDQARPLANQDCSPTQSSRNCQGSKTGRPAQPPATGRAEGENLSQSHTIGIPNRSSSEQAIIKEKQQGYTCREESGGKICTKKMASEQAAPPVPYTRLKEITENVRVYMIAAYISPLLNAQ